MGRRGTATPPLWGTPPGSSSFCGKEWYTASVQSDRAETYNAQRRTRLAAQMES